MLYSGYMKQLKLLVFMLVIAVVVLDVITLLIPMPTFVTNPGSYLLQIGIVSSFSLNYFAAAILFLYGLRGFKPEMRRSYSIITWSMVYAGIANLQYPILVYAGLIPRPWTSYGGSFWLVVPGIVALYFGVRHFAKTLGAHAWSASLPLVLGLWGAISVVALIIPARLDEPYVWYAVHQVGAVTNMVWSLATLGILVQITRLIGPAYLPALRWLLVANALRGAGFLHVLIAGYFGVNTPYNESGPIAAPFILTAICYVVAGFYFCKIRFLELTASAKTTSGSALLDAVVGLMALASNSRDVAHLKERLRMTTAKITPGRPISPENQQALARIYHELEDYLVYRERLKQYDRKTLRAQLSDEVLGILDERASKPPASTPTSNVG